MTAERGRFVDRAGQREYVVGILRGGRHLSVSEIGKLLEDKDGRPDKEGLVVAADTILDRIAGKAVGALIRPAVIGLNGAELRRAEIGSVAMLLEWAASLESDTGRSAELWNRAFEQYKISARSYAESEEKGESAGDYARLANAEADPGRRRLLMVVAMEEYSVEIAALRELMKRLATIDNVTLAEFQSVREVKEEKENARTAIAKALESEKRDEVQSS